MNRSRQNQTDSDRTFRQVFRNRPCLAVSVDRLSRS